MLPEAVIFDFDGVIVDTEPFHHRCFVEVLKPFGISFTWDEYVQTYIGYDDRDALREAFRRAGRGDLPDGGLMSRLLTEKAELFPRLAAEDAVPYPGVVELVRRLSEEIPLGLCSGALRSDILPIIERLGIDRCFTVIVTADDVTVSKPDPESYRLALGRLAARFPGTVTCPSRCCAIEDTPAGIASAKGAGLAVVAVTNSHPPEHLGGADLIVDSLEGISGEDLGALTEGS